MDDEVSSLTRIVGFGNKQTARDFLNEQGAAGGLRTFDEAMEVVTMLDWKKDLKQSPPRNVVHIIHADGFMNVSLGADNGLLLYDERGQLIPYSVVYTDLVRFVEHYRLHKRTAGFMAMDRASLFALQGNGHFDASYLKQFVGIDKRFTEA